MYMSAPALKERKTGSLYERVCLSEIEAGWIFQVRKWWENKLWWSPASPGLDDKFLSLSWPHHSHVKMTVHMLISVYSKCQSSFIPFQNLLLHQRDLEPEIFSWLLESVNWWNRKREGVRKGKVPWLARYWTPTTHTVGQCSEYWCVRLC